MIAKLSPFRSLARLRIRKVQRALLRCDYLDREPIGGTKEKVVMQRLQLAALTAGIACATFIGAAESAEHRIKRSNLPVQVQRAVDKESAAGKVRGFATETEKGEVYYEAELIVGGHSKDVIFDSNGTVVEVEEEVSLGSLPEAVRRGLVAQAGNRKIIRVESRIKEGQLFGYEAQVKTGAKRFEIHVGPLGQALGDAR